MPSALEPPRAIHESLKGIPYEGTTASNPPIPITTKAKAPSHKTLNRLRKPRTRQPLPAQARSKLDDETRRDSGIAASSSSSIRDSGTTMATEIEPSPSIRQSASVPSFRAPPEQPPSTAPNSGTPQSPNPRPGSDPAPLSQKPFLGILTNIPTGSFEDLSQPGQVDFSKRGSMLLGGKKAITKRDGISNGNVVGSRRYQNGTKLGKPVNLPARVLSADEEAISFKVRSMYEDGGSGRTHPPSGLEGVLENGHLGHGNAAKDQPSIKVIENGKATNGTSTPDHPVHQSGAATPSISSLLREETELAGGIEDWEDIHNSDVDRYGFIVPRKFSSQASSTYSGHCTPEPPRIQRMSTLLQLASEAPRRSRSRLSNTRTANESPARSANADGRSISRGATPITKQVRPHSSQSSYRSTSGQSSKLRTATNKLPHNKDRRCVDEAGDMLTLPPGLADIAEDEESGNQRISELKAREFERDEKWRKMAKCVKSEGRQHGGGMVFEFDTRSPKLVERTWKGIPDKWRATAWHAFLNASARKRKPGSYPSDEELRAVFQQLVEKPSPDDYQIDIDVPRTINSHIMFRRRYRGGQRLLFRVLHCMSIYFPETGYAQGMAALAATLLCYFDEEGAFVMMVRLWQERGLEALYRHGFGGLMAALEEFEGEWLGRQGEVGKKLNDLDIKALAYGTRWYLTLFNYSIPFAAQLRVWDVFMLLGEPDIPYPLLASSSSSSSPPPSLKLQTNTTTTTTTKEPPPISFHHGLDVLHACSAALIDGTREILLDSDFENAMKVLTSWIPVKDEELMMRVAKVEWKMGRRKGG